jgi:hypothetical protein
VDLAPTLHGNLGVHADHKVVCFDGTVEVICRFAFFGERGVIHIPTIVSGSWRGFPVGSPEAWAVAYTLLIAEEERRAAKADVLFEYLRGGADRARVEAMLAQPLPRLLAERMGHLLRGA